MTSPPASPPAVPEPAGGGLRVGCTFDGGRAGQLFGAGLEALELEPDVLGRVQLKTLARWRRRVPEGAQFVPCVHPGVVAAGFGEGARESWERTLEAVECLGATTVVLYTPAHFRPTEQNRQALIAFCRGVISAPGPRIAWRAEGLWATEPEDRDAVCAAAGVVPVVDPLAPEGPLDDPLLGPPPPPPGPRVYWRVLGGAGMRSRLSEFELDRLAALCAERTSGHVVFAAPSMLRVAARFRALLEAQ